MPDIAHNHRTPARFCAYVTELGQLTLAGSIDVGQNGCCKEVDFKRSVNSAVWPGAFPRPES
ncbi:MAG: hypothetical protein QGI86_16515 [Candidatus Poribacteria bacterium]|nr:hypothetical protein [Candidatus Poribacteria bacterium]MDP6747379.1 hypothetical protein [Candidatus Poribacteria bacterium]MDP6995648.1 hypothetical protein [Candidatus Poribacteria bacterium]